MRCTFKSHIAGYQPWLALLIAMVIVAVPIRHATAQSEATVVVSEPAQGTFLVAKRSLVDPSFGESVVYLVAHDEDGSVGVIINRRSKLDLAETVPDLENARESDHSLYYGGPVELSMVLMLTRGGSEIEGLMHVGDGVHISSERPVIEAALAGEDSQRELRFYIGYSGWAGGQLAQELVRGSWHIVRGDPDAIFAADTRGLWDELIDALEPDGIQVEIRPETKLLALSR